MNKSAVKSRISIQGYVGLCLNILGMIALICVIKYTGEHPAQANVWSLYLVPFGFMVLGVGLSFGDMMKESDTYVQYFNFPGPL